MNTPFKKRESPLAYGTKQTTVDTVNSDRVKYTATMEKGLRVRVKIAAAKANLQFSQFIEDAVREKMEREGY